KWRSTAGCNVAFHIASRDVAAFSRAPSGCFGRRIEYRARDSCAELDSAVAVQYARRPRGPYFYRASGPATRHREASRVPETESGALRNVPGAHADRSARILRWLHHLWYRRNRQQLLRHPGQSVSWGGFLTLRPGRSSEFGGLPGSPPS